MKNNYQCNFNGVRMGGGSIEHPLSIHSASIGTRWKPRGFQVLMTLVLLFTMGIGQMWGADPEVVTYTFTNTSCLANQTYTSYGTPGSETFGYASSIPVVDTNGENALTLTGAIYNNNNSNGRYIKYDSSKGIALERPGAIYFTLPKAATSITINIKSKAAGFGAAGEAYNAVTTSNLLTCSGDELGAAGSSGGTFTANNVPAGNYKIYSKQDLSGSSSWGIVSIVITYPASSGPVDPTITFNDGAYTVGDAALDLSSLFSSNSAGAVTYSVKNDGETSASIDGTNFTATAAGTCVVTASQAAETGKYNAKAVDANIVVSASSGGGDPTPSYCVELYPATSGASPTGKNQELLLQTVAPNASYGGKIYTAGAKNNNWSESFTYSANGLSLNKGGADSARVELTHLMKVGTVITATLVNPNTEKARGYKLLNMAKTTKATWQATTTDPQVYTYTVVEGDGLAGTNMFLLQRAETSALKELKVSNCGAELHELTSEVSVAGKGTVTLSKSLLAEGATATATYSDIDAAYDFDEWVISGTGASLSDAKANPVTITMGSADAVVTLKLKAASVKHTVTYYDGEAILANKLGEELIEHNDHPTGAALAPRKLGYTFGGWSTTEDGAAATLSDINVTENMPLYAVWNAVNCATKSGTIYTMSIAVAPLANCTITSTTGTHDLYQYEGVSGGEALLGNKGTSNNCILQTNKKILLKDDNSYIKLDFDCPLKEGDKIVYSVESNNPVVSTGNSKPSTPLATLDRSKTEFVIPAESGLIDAQTIYVWKGGGNTTVTYINIVRPAKYAVTFNMHGHGDAPAAQSITDGGKVTKPSDPSASGWDFGGWYKESTYDNEWNFDNDVVSAATEIHAKWTEHVLSNNVALGTLTVNGEDVAIVPSQLVYAVELPFGTTAIPTVAATAADANAKACNVTQALAVDGSATIYVKAEDNTTEATYTINFSVATSKDIELVWDKSKERCDATKPDANVLIAAMSQYLSASYTGSAAEGGSLTTGKTTGSKIIITAKPGYAFKAMGFYGKIEDGTCNFYNDGVVETIGTSTGDACYANVFSNDEVHEFVIELTGSNGVYIRNMQLTIIKACTPITLAWDEEPVEFEVGKSGYAIAATANNGGTVAYSSTDGDVIAVNGSTGALTVSALGSVTLKAATAEGDGTTYCANGGNNIEISKAVNTYYLVKFDAQNGDAATEVKYFSGDAAIALPAAPTFSGYDFQGWFDAETGGNKYTAAITPTASTTVYAQWVAQCAGATITTQPTGASYLTGRTATDLVCEATAGNGGALTYEWFTCDDEYKANPVAATATPSTAVAGTFYYFCKVTEEGCDVEAFSDVVTITVADKDAICLVKAELAPGSSAASITSTSGYYKDDENIAINIKKDLKLGSTGNYVKVAIDGANFQDGDVVEITLASDKTASAWLQIFTDEGTTMVAEMTSGVSREHPNYLTISGVPANTKTLYLYRTEAADGNMNPYPTSMAVYRTCAPILNKVTVAGVDGTPDNTNHIAIEVPFSTLDAALDAIVYDWVSNNDAWTAAHDPAAANAWEWGVENTVTLTDKDNDQSVYYVTISKAAASSDATLSALTVNGQAISLEDGVFEYSFELPYGTTTAPTVIATPNHVAAVATVDPCTVNGATITVVPEIGESEKLVYTLNFTIAAWKEIVIWDGSTMSAVATSPDATTGFAWAVNGFGSIANYAVSYAAKDYVKCLPSGGSASSTRNIELTVPAGYVAKFYVVGGSHSDDEERTAFIATTATKTYTDEGILTLVSPKRVDLAGGMSEIVGTGTYYINMTASYDFYEIRAYLRPGYKRNAMLGAGVYGTICVDHNVAIEDIHGISVYELQGRENTYGKLVFDEIISGEMEAGVPYVFQAEGDEFLLYYGGTKVGAPVDKHNGMYGTFSNITLLDEDLGVNDLSDIYYFAQKALWSCDGAVDLTIPANRAYVKLSEIDYLPANNQPAPGRRRVTMAVNGEKVVTDIDNLFESEQPVKVMIDGQLFIIRGEKMFDATGRLVK